MSQTSPQRPHALRAPSAGLLNAKVIDLHAHVVLEATIGAAGRFGPTLGTHPDGTPWFQIGETYRLNGVRYQGSPFMDVGVRLARMDAQGIDYQLLSPNPLTYFHFIPVDEAVAYCRVHNDALAELVAAHPDRLGGLAALPVQDPQAAADELERAVRELGLMGAGMGTDQPRRLHDPAMDVLYARATALDVPLFIHPGPAGIDGPPGDPALREFELDIVCGFTGQETVAVASLIFGGVLDRHPGLDLCISHGGGATALGWHRMARAAERRAWVSPALREPGAFAARLHRLWVDVHSGHPRSHELLAETFGEQHLVYGTNFAGWDAPDEAHHDAGAALYADNARRLLRATAPAMAPRRETAR